MQSASIAIRPVQFSRFLARLQFARLFRAANALKFRAVIFAGVTIPTSPPALTPPAHPADGSVPVLLAQICVSANRCITLYSVSFGMWLRRLESNQLSLAYEASEKPFLPAAL